ncbi:hypothetical protein ACHAWF_007033 [Thalassiosira exigua]
MKKSRITTRIKDKTGIAKSKNRCEDLVALRQQWQSFSKNLKFLITTLAANRDAMLSHSKARLEVAKAVNSLTVDTPLFKCAGDIPAAAVGTTDGGSDEASGTVAHQSDPTSYAAIHLQLHKKHKMYADKFQEHILNYVTEWERILSTRIARHIKDSEKLRVDLDHYGRKVEELNKSQNKTMSKGKSISDSNVDKRKRNEQKLVQARQENDRFVNDLCGFMEEVMDRGWKDLHPVLVKMAQFDATLSNEETMLLKGSMQAVTEQMKAMGAKYPNLKSAGRLKELETWSLESLNKVNPSLRSDSPLMIAQGGGEAASYVSGTGETGGSAGIHQSLVGSEVADELGVGGGGLFGSSAVSQSSRNSSFSDVHGQQPAPHRGSGVSVGDEYDWATGGRGGGALTVAAPGPGVVNGTAYAPQPPASFARSAPPSGGLPPLGPQNRAGSYGAGLDGSLGSSRHSSSDALALRATMQAGAPPPSMGDIFAGGVPAPAPAGMPPPPPPVPPPLPPQSLSPHMANLSMYGSTPPPPQPATQAAFMSPGGQSVATGGTNPFDDTFGSPQAAYPTAAHATSLTGGVPAGYSVPSHDPFGGSQHSQGGSTNPFG